MTVDLIAEPMYASCQSLSISAKEWHAKAIFKIRFLKQNQHFQSPSLFVASNGYLLTLLTCPCQRLSSCKGNTAVAVFVAPAVLHGGLAPRKARGCPFPLKHEFINGGGTVFFRKHKWMVVLVFFQRVFFTFPLYRC